MRFSQDYFEHTMDMDFLREYGYPFLKPQAEFYADYIVLNQNGAESAPFPKMPLFRKCPFSHPPAFETSHGTCQDRFGTNIVKVYH